MEKTIPRNKANPSYTVAIIFEVEREEEVSAVEFDLKFHLIDYLDNYYDNFKVARSKFLHYPYLRQPTYLTNLIFDGVKDEKALKHISHEITDCLTKSVCQTFIVSEPKIIP
jgi:hypothetical protein